MKTKPKHLSGMLMPLLCRLSIAPCLIAFSAAPVARAQTYKNPVLYISSDPDVSLFDGQYNMINPSGDHYLYRTSKDLINWSTPVNILTQASGDVVWEGYMTKNTNNGDYWLYYTVEHTLQGPDVTEVKVAKSTNGPAGPWQIMGFSIPSAIDPCFFQDSDGSKYLYYKHEVTGLNIWVQKLCSYDCLNGSPILLLSPDCSAGTGDPGWECCGEPQLEGPCMVKFGSKYFLLYDAGYFNDTNCYCIGFAYSTSPVGPFTRRSGGDPIMSNWESPNCYSIGAPDVVPDGGTNYWVVYRQWPNPPNGSHHFCIDRLSTIDPANNKINADATHAVTLPAPVPLP